MSQMQEQIKINLIVNNTHIEISPPIRGSLYQLFKKKLGYKPSNSIWVPSYNNGWDGWISLVCFDKKRCKCAVKKEGMHFPAGLFSLAREFFIENNIKISVIDSRNNIEHDDVCFNSEYQLRDYQKIVVDDSYSRTRGIIKAATGAGKTIIAAGLFSKIKSKKAIFFVTSKDLMNQAYEEFKKFISPSSSIGIVGGGKCRISQINVVTVQTAIRSLGFEWINMDSDEDDEKEDVNDDVKRNIYNLISDAGCIICDEVQHWAAETCQIISDSCKNAKYRYGISATPWRDMDDDILIDACFGRKLCDIDASFLIEKGVLVSPIINMIKLNSRMGGTYADVYKAGIVENDIRNNIIKECAEYLSKNGRRVLILVKQIKHGEYLESIIKNSVFIHGSCSSKDRQSHIESMRDTESNVITIASSIFDEGIDVKPLDALVLAGGGKSQTRALQRIGRVIRPYKDKKNAIVIDFFDDMKYMRNHSKKRIKMYKTEKLFKIRSYDVDEIVKNARVLLSEHDV